MIPLKNFALIALLLCLLYVPALGAESGLGGDEWERTVKAAEQEGQVAVYKVGPDAEWQAFQKRFPKIKLVHGRHQRGPNPAAHHGGEKSGQISC